MLDSRSCIVEMVKLNYPLHAIQKNIVNGLKKKVKNKMMAVKY